MMSRLCSCDALPLAQCSNLFFHECKCWRQQKKKTVLCNAKCLIALNSATRRTKNYVRFESGPVRPKIMYALVRTK